MAERTEKYVWLPLFSGRSYQRPKAAVQSAEHSLLLRCGELRTDLSFGFMKWGSGFLTSVNTQTSQSAHICAPIRGSICAVPVRTGRSWLSSSSMSPTRPLDMAQTTSLSWNRGSIHAKRYKIICWSGNVLPFPGEVIRTRSKLHVEQKETKKKTYRH